MRLIEQQLERLPPEDRELLEAASLAGVEFSAAAATAAAGGYPGQSPPTIPVESAQATFDRAYAAAGSPWISDGTRAQLMTYANAAPVTSDAQRRQRFYALQALMLGGPDGQVM